jgi:hypothetical protein
MRWAHQRAQGVSFSCAHQQSILVGWLEKCTAPCLVTKHSKLVCHCGSACPGKCLRTLVFVCAAGVRAILIELCTTPFECNSTLLHVTLLQLLLCSILFTPTPPQIRGMPLLLHTALTLHKA